MNIPNELKARAQFLTWIWPAASKKLPCSVSTGEVGDGTDPALWGSFDAALAAYEKRKHAGIGFALSSDDPYVGVDLDDCIENGEITHPDAHAIVAISDWWDISPSGTGLKTIVRGQVPSSAKGKTLGGLKVEIYPAKRFFTLTGQSFEGRSADVQTVNGELTQLYSMLKPYAKPQTESPRPRPQATPDSDHARRYALAALESEHQAMLAATDGERHNLRIKAAYALAGYSPHLTDQEIFDALAVNFGDDRTTAEKTIHDGIASGKEELRTIPERALPAFDALGHACCPTHGTRLVACRNGNGYRCDAQPMALCFWWQADGYTPPAERIIDGFTILDPDELREVLRVVIAERDRYREQVEHLETELKHVKDHNRFVTQAHGAPGIATPSKRLTFIELKKELDRVPVEEREPDQFVKVRPSYMAACSNQDRSNISRHLGEFKAAGLIEKKVERTYNPETKKWRAETFVRPLVNLDDPSQVVIASKPRGRQACSACHSEKIERQVRIKCLDCGHVEWSEPELVNPPESELQTAHQEETPVEAAITFFEEQPEPVAAAPDGLNCKLHIREETVVPLFTCAAAHQTARPSTPPLIDLDNAPGVLAGKIAPDDPWLAYQREMQAARGVS